MCNRIIILLLTTFFTISHINGQAINLNDQWKFNLGDDARWATSEFNDDSWITLSSAKAWENQGFVDYDGFAWYRRKVVVPNGMRNQVRRYGGMKLIIDTIDDADQIYFNGYLIGSTGSFPPDYKSEYNKRRVYTIPQSYINFGRPNQLAVRVYDGGGYGGIISETITIRPLVATDVLEHTFNVPGKDWILSSIDPKHIVMSMKNPTEERLRFNMLFVLRTDQHVLIDSLSVPVNLTPGQWITTSLPLKLSTPGFYRCTLYFLSDGITTTPERFNIGFEPEKIVAPPDSKSDFNAFWERSLADLAKVEPRFKMTLIPERSEGPKNIYHVEMFSYMNVLIEGYYAVPKGQGKFPAIANFMGYGSAARYPDPHADPGFAEFILSVRGQGIQRPTSAYGSWITWGLASKETYYYRGAYLDLVRAIDFLTSRPEIDSDKIVADGGSQGGAFAIAAAALDKRIKAISPTIPFLSDFRNYFRIAPWPRSEFERYLIENKDESWDRIYHVLSYFDIKNLASRIECPVLMAVGLQDEVCPPHINFAAYNQIKSEKRFRVYHDRAHSTPAEWREIRLKFFREKLGMGN